MISAGLASFAIRLLETVARVKAARLVDCMNCLLGMAVSCVYFTVQSVADVWVCAKWESERMSCEVLGLVRR